MDSPTEGPNVPRAVEGSGPIQSQLSIEKITLNFETLKSDGEVIGPSENMGCEDTLLLLGGLEDHLSGGVRLRAPLVIPFSKNEPGTR